MAYGPLPATAAPEVRESRTPLRPLWRKSERSTGDPAPTVFGNTTTSVNYKWDHRDEMLTSLLLCKCRRAGGRAVH